MQTTVKAAKATKAAKAAIPATTEAPKASPRTEALAAHDAARFTGATYAGLSKPRNSGITKAPNLSTSKAVARNFAKLTERMHKTLAELARGYGAKRFPLCGIDRGQAAIFIASGFFIRDGETHATLSGETVKRYTA